MSSDVAIYDLKSVQICRISVIRGLCATSHPNS
jgi:hypothetical protein